MIAVAGMFTTTWQNALDLAELYANGGHGPMAVSPTSPHVERAFYVCPFWHLDLELRDYVAHVATPAVPS